MNTLKKIVSIVLMLSILCTVALLAVSCGDKDEEENKKTEHCPADCECRKDENASGGVTEHCPSDCECRFGDLVTDTTPTSITYVVVVRDDRGGIVPGAKVLVTNGTSRSEKTTDKNGYLTFPLTQGTWTAQVIEAPDGYRFDPSAKFNFDTEGVCAIELQKPEGYTFNVSSYYDGESIKDAVVVLYAYNETSDLYDIEVAKGMTNEDGKVLLEAVVGNYMATIVVDGYAVENIYINAPATSNTFEAGLVHVEGTSELAPIFPGYDFDGTISAKVNAGSVVWYAINNTTDSTLVIESESAVVYFDGEEFTADEDGVVTVELPAVMRGVVVIGLSTALDEGTDSYVATVTYEEGTINNPIELGSLDEIANVSVEESEMGNETYYTWVADFNGYVVISSATENANIVVTNMAKGIYEVIGAETTAVKVFVEDGDVLTIAVGTLAVDEDYNYSFPAAELEIASYSYVTYGVSLANVYNVPFAGVKVTLSAYDDDYNKVPVATMVTDALGYAEFTLPKLGEYDNYFITVDLAGYSIPEEVTVNNESPVTTVAVANGTEESPFLVTGEEALNVKAGETQYFIFKTLLDTDITVIINDFDNDWIVSEAEAKFDIVFDGVTYNPVINNMMGNAQATFSVDVANENTAEYFVFSITNNTEFDAINDYENGKYAALAVSLAKAGSMDKPFELGAIDAPISADVPEGFGVYYKWISTANGYLVVTSESAKNVIMLNNYGADREDYSDDITYISGNGYVFIPVAIGDEIVIEVGTTDYMPASIEFALEIVTENNAENTFDVDATDKDAVSVPVLKGTDVYVTLTGANGKVIMIDQSNAIVTYGDKVYNGADGTQYIAITEDAAVLKLSVNPEYTYRNLNITLNVNDVLEANKETVASIEAFGMPVSYIYVAPAAGTVTLTTTFAENDMCIITAEGSVSSYDFSTSQLTISASVAAGETIELTIGYAGWPMEDYEIPFTLTFTPDEAVSE